ncbi:hypothetical protein [Vibrio sp. F13]|uniref:hypothetical protein n=1 Tax=Vibrio sp. F13 TaxID=2070777 RepID=UPI0010BD4FA9|nr:hypothetical protein [Vibrio sp. F13]TKF96444.1 hypothetical protein FCV76_22740 [Vibrio sp. F13]
MLFKENPLLQAYRKQLLKRLRIRIFLYVLVAFCGFGWAVDWFYTNSVLHLILVCCSSLYLLNHFPSKAKLLKKDSINKKYQVFAKVLLTEQESQRISKDTAHRQSLAELEEYLSEQEKRNNAD